MFTIDHIKLAHSKVRSGADFPAYIKSLKDLGVSGYETYVSDGHSDFYGTNEYKTGSAGKYESLTVSDNSYPEQFINDLKAHQQGKTDYMTFCNDCAKSGIEKWMVDIDKMTCTYYDKSGNEILEKQVPSL